MATVTVALLAPLSASTVAATPGDDDSAPTTALAEPATAPEPIETEPTETEPTQVPTAAEAAPPISDPSADATTTPPEGSNTSTAVPVEAPTAPAAAAMLAPPVAVDDAATIWGNHSATVAVLDNDTAPEGTRLRLWNGTTAVDSIQNIYGTWGLSGNTFVTHTPPDGRAGPRSIQYVLIAPDGTQSIATVRVQVDYINPPYGLGDQVTTAYRTPVTVDVLANDGSGSNSAGDRYPIVVDSLRLLDGTTEVSTLTDARGTFSVVAGQIAFQPADGYFGNATVRYRYRTSVRQVSNSVSLTVVVTPTPDAVDDTATATAGTGAVRVAVTTNDFTPPGTTIDRVSLVAANGNGANVIDQPGVGRWSFEGLDVVFTPADGFVGTASAPYRIVYNRYITADATVAVTIDAPAPLVPVAVDDAVTIYANHTAVVAVLANDTVPVGTTLQLWNGTSAVSSITNISGVWTVDGDTVAHTPPDGRAGPRTIQYVLTGPDGTTSIATVRVQVNSISPPVVISDFATTPYETAVTSDVLANDFGGSNRDGERYPIVAETLRIETPAGEPVVVAVTANDFTPPGTTIDRVTLVAANGNGAITIVQPGIGTWTYERLDVVFTPDAGFIGTASAPYRIVTSRSITADAVVTVEVRPLPTITTEIDRARITFKQVAVVDVTANDTATGAPLDRSSVRLIGPDGQPTSSYTESRGTWSVADGIVSFDPRPHARGTFVATYTVGNGFTTATGTVEVTVTTPGQM